MLRFGLLLLIVAFSLSNNTNAQNQVCPDLGNEKIFGINKEKAHATFFSFPNRTDALNLQPEQSENYFSLNGLWKFNWSECPEARPKEFYQILFQDSLWSDIPVPSNWEMEGYGISGYVNPPDECTKDSNALSVGHDGNPVGSYRKHFELPKNWETKEVFLTLGAVNSAFYLWVNGQKVGYSQDRKLPAEFNITSYLNPGKNLLAIEVYRFIDGSFPKYQDSCRFSGIERDVYLQAKPKTSIRDFKVEASLSANYTKAVLKIDVELQSNNPIRMSDYQLEARLYKDDVQLKKLFLTPVGNAKNYREEMNLVYPDLWSSEKPNLYQLLLSLIDKNGHILESTSISVGLREVKMDGGQLLINGKAVLLKDVNRHGQNPKTAHVISRESMLQDIRLMKQFNINTVRTSHYPNDPYWYKLCDQYGIYLIDEVNTEYQVMENQPEDSLGDDREAKYLESISRIRERDKNHPSVIILNIGNEAGFGMNFKADMVHQLDPNWPVYYSDKEIHPALWEVKKAYQYIDFKMNNAFINIQNRYDFTNLSVFDFEWQMLKDGVEIGKGNFPNVNVEPGQSVDMALPMKGDLFGQDVEYLFLISAKTNQNTELLPIGHEVAWEQFEIKRLRGFKYTNLDQFNGMQLKENQDFVAITGDDFEFQFSKKTGKLQKWDWHQKNLLANEKGFTFNFWRGKDFENGLAQRASVWKSAGENVELIHFALVKINAKEIQIKTQHKLGNGIALWNTVYTIAANGELYVDNTFLPQQKDLPEMPKLGLTLELDSAFQQLDWYGRGPFESYCDRKSGAKVGVYSSDLEAQLVNFIRPQENSNHADVRWFALRDSLGYGILVDADPLLEFSAQNYSMEDFDQPDKSKNKHQTDLKKRPYVTLDIDLEQKCVGGEDGLVSRAHQEYTVFAKPEHYRFRMAPIAPYQKDLQKIWKEKPLLVTTEREK